MNKNCFPNLTAVYSLQNHIIIENQNFEFFLGSDIVNLKISFQYVDSVSKKIWDNGEFYK